MPTFSIPLSGLTAMSTALSAIANNLANLNTVGYKDMRVLFRDLFYQTIGSSGSGNPTQLGAGVAVSSMPSMFTQGNVDPTGVSTDVAINDAGFFIVQKNGMISYTRAGNFTVDDTDYLVTSEGEQVLGYPELTITFNPGHRDNRSSASVRPSRPGMTMSVITNSITREYRSNISAASAALRAAITR